MSFPPGMQSTRTRQASDMNDFPALGGGQQQSYTSSNNVASPGTYAQASTSVAAPPGLGTVGSSNVVPNGSSGGSGGGGNLRTEDFPALGGKNAQNPSAKMTSPSPPPANLMNQQQQQHSQQQQPPSSLQPQPPNTGQTSPFPQHMTAASSASGAAAAAGWDPSQPVTKPIQQVVHSPVDKWGLAALLQLIRTGGNGDQLALSLGEDLARIGLDMASSNPLYPTFIAPWAEPEQLRGVYLEEEYRIPQCYNVNTPALNKHKLTLLSDETLFYAFYSSPGDVMQIQAAHELYSRQWRYHKQLGVWLTKEPGVEPVQKGPDFERGTYIIFDPTQFTRVETPKDFHLVYDLLEDRPAFVGGGGGEQQQQQQTSDGQQQQQQAVASGQQAQGQPQQQQQQPPQQQGVASGR